MNFKKHPLFFGFVIVCLVAFLALAVMAWMARAGYQESVSDLDRTIRDLDTARALQPPPAEAYREQAQANLDELLVELERRIETASGNLDAIDTDPPSNPNRLFFELESYAAELRRAARNVRPIYSDDDPTARMAVPENFDDYSFGFDRFLTGDQGGTPPPEELVPIVHQQKEIMDRLVRQVYDSRPLAFVNVRRENAQQVRQRRTGEGAVEETAAQAARRRRGADDADDALRLGGQTLRVPGAVETLAFSVTFQGYTLNLRQFLRALEDSELPLVVRSVVVEPLESSMIAASQDEEEEDDAQQQAGAFGNIFGNQDAEEPEEEEADDTPDEPLTVPVVDQNISQFTVVVEFVDLQVKPDAEPIAGSEGDLAENDEA
ncbi:MAG: hypothetical protein ACFB21_11705 [Opitutales bacterium]